MQFERPPEGWWTCSSCGYRFNAPPSSNAPSAALDVDGVPLVLAGAHAGSECFCDLCERCWEDVGPVSCAHSRVPMGARLPDPCARVCAFVGLSVRMGAHMGVHACVPACCVHGC